MSHVLECDGIELSSPLSKCERQGYLYQRVREIRYRGRMNLLALAHYATCVIQDFITLDPERICLRHLTNCHSNIILMSIVTI